MVSNALPPLLICPADTAFVIYGLLICLSGLRDEGRIDDVGDAIGIGTDGLGFVGTGRIGFLFFGCLFLEPFFHLDNFWFGLGFRVRRHLSELLLLFLQLLELLLRDALQLTLNFFLHFAFGNGASAGNQVICGTNVHACGRGRDRRRSRRYMLILGDGRDGCLRDR